MAFPENEIQALALLYVQKQDITGQSPAALLDMYHSAVKELYDAQKKPTADGHPEPPEKNPIAEFLDYSGPLEDS